jgi:uncharacterized protein YicC (UPF0701 family)
MLKSMTGYDLRTVNNRFLDINWRAPQELVALEIPLMNYPRISSRIGVINSSNCRSI